MSLSFRLEQEALAPVYERLMGLQDTRISIETEICLEGDDWIPTIAESLKRTFRERLGLEEVTDICLEVLMRNGADPAAGFYGGVFPLSKETAKSEDSDSVLHIPHASVRTHVRLPYGRFTEGMNMIMATYLGESTVFSIMPWDDSTYDLDVDSILKKRGRDRGDRREVLTSVLDALREVPGSAAPIEDFRRTYGL